MLTYEQGVTPFRDTKRLSENDKVALMGGTLQKSTSGSWTIPLRHRHNLAE